MKKTLRLGLAGLLLSCSVNSYTPIISVAGLPAAGRTICDMGNQPVILINSMYVEQPIFKNNILIHEKTHVRNARNYPGGCETWINRYNTDEDFRINEEVSAYCEELNYMENHGNKRNESIAKISQLLSKGGEYRSSKSVEEVKEVFNKTCFKPISLGYDLNQYK